VGGRGFLPFSSHACLAWEALSCRTASPLSLLDNIDVSALHVICFPEPVFTHALHRTALHPPAAHYPLLPIGLQVCLTAWQRPCPNASAQPTQPGMDAFSRSLCRFPRVGRLEGHGITVLGFPCPRRSCSGQSSCAQFLFASL
jgi:hypothetical protein